MGFVLIKREDGRAVLLGGVKGKGGMIGDVEQVLESDAVLGGKAVGEYPVGLTEIDAEAVLEFLRGGPRAPTTPKGKKASAKQRAARFTDWTPDAIEIVSE